MSDPSEGPMAGIRILDLSTVVAGPFSTMMLADQGAEVIKIEPPHGGDHGRYIGPGLDQFGALYASCNRNKTSIVIQLADPDGVELVRRLAAQVDVVVQNFRPGVAERLGIGYSDLTQTNPNLIYVSISGFGPDGPYSAQRAYDSVIQAISGTAVSQSSPTAPPALVSSLICDKVTALTTAQAITAALFARTRTGKGEHVRISLLDANLAFNWPDVMWNHTFLSPDVAYGATLSQTYRLWKTLDGYIAIVFIAEDAFRGWCRALDVGAAYEAEEFDSLKSQRARFEQLFPLWEQRIASFTTEEVLKRFHAQSVPAGPVRTHESLLTDSQILHNQAIMTVEDTELGPMRMVAPAARFSSFAPPEPRRAPFAGEHTLNVLKRFGVAAEDAQHMLTVGIVRQR